MRFFRCRRTSSDEESLRPDREKVFLMEEVFDLGAGYFSVIVLAERLVRGE